MLNKSRYPLPFVVLSLLLLLPGLSAMAQYRYISLDESYLKFEDEGKWGISTAKGRILVYPEYDHIGWSDDVNEDSPFPTYRSRVGYLSDNKWGLITTKGKKITSSSYDSLRHFELDMAPAAVGGKWALIDHRGDAKTAYAYSELDYRKDLNLYLARQGQKFVLLGKNAERVFLDSEYSFISPSKEGRLVAKTVAGDFQMLDTLMQPIFSGRYDSMALTVGGAVKVWQNGLLGLIGRDGKMLLTPSYSKITISEDGEYLAESFPSYFPVLADGAVGTVIYSTLALPLSENRYAFIDEKKYGLIDEKGNQLTSAAYDTIATLDDGLFSVEKNNLFGTIDSKGRRVLPIAYKTLHIDSASGLVMAERFDGKLLYTKGGSPVSKQAFDELWSLENGLFAVRNTGGKIRIMRHNGHINPYHNFDKVENAGFGHTIFTENKMQGMLDSMARLLLQPVFKVLTALDVALATFEEDGATGIIDLKTLRPIAGPLQRAKVLGPNILFWKNEKQGLMNRNGNELLAANYDSIGHDNEGKFYSAWKKNELTLIDENGAILYGPRKEFAKIFAMQDERMRVFENGSYGYVDRHGRLRITNHYDEAREFSEDRAAVMLRNKWGYIDNAETLRVQPQYDSLSDLKNGLAIVKKGKDYGLIDADGNTPLAIEYKMVRRDESGNFIVMKNGRYGLANSKGSVVVPFNYDSIFLLSKTLIGLHQGQKFGIANTQGQFVQPMQYDGILTANGGILLNKGKGSSVKGTIGK